MWVCRVFEDEEICALQNQQNTTTNILQSEKHVLGLMTDAEICPHWRFGRSVSTTGTVVLSCDSISVVNLSCQVM